MADNATVYSGSDGTAIPVATDEIAGKHHQLVVVEWGAPDAATRVTLDDPLPVQQVGVVNVIAVGGTIDTITDGALARTTVRDASYPDFTVDAQWTAFSDLKGNLRVNISGVDTSDGGDPLPVTVADTVTVDGTVATTGVYHSAHPTLSDGDVRDLPLDENGYLSVNIVAADATLATYETATHVTTVPSDATSAVAGMGVIRKDTATDLSGGNGNWSVPQVNATGALRTDGSSVTQPVSGTVTANAGSGTMAVSAASLPLPTGAATALKQPALGTAGTPAADVITVQGVASMTALKVDGSAVTQPVSGTVTANAGTNLNTSALALDATLTGGTQKSKLVDSGGSNVATVSSGGALKVDGSAATQPVSGTVAVSNSFALDATLTGGTAKTKLVDSGGTNVATISAGGAVKVDGSAVTQPVSFGAATAGTGSLTALNQAVTVDVKAVTSLSVDSRGSGTWTLILEATTDDTNWFPVYGLWDSAGGAATLGLPVNSWTGTTGVLLEVPVYGWSQFRVRVSAFTSGTATVVVRQNGSSSPAAMRSLLRGSTTLPTDSGTNGIPVMAWGDRSGTTIMGARATSSQPSTITDANGAPLSMTQRGAMWVNPTISLQAPSVVTPTIQAAAYSAGDQLHSSTALNFASVTPASGRPIQITGATLIDKASQKAWTELWLFTSAPSLVNPNANDVFSITDANLASSPPFAIIDFLAADYRDTAANSFCMGSLLGGKLDIVVVTASTSISGFLVTRGTPTYASTSDLIVSISANAL